MGAFQFIRIEAYGRAASKKGGSGHSVRSIIAEAAREPDACPHVETPGEPIIRHGVPLDQVEKMANAWAEGETDSRGHKLRKDAVCLLAGVFSVPAGFDDWDGLRDTAIASLKTKYGDRLVSVVEHKDESNPHCHFYCVARPGERFDSLHDGRAAFNAAKASGSKKIEAERAASAAMRDFQDRYFLDVASRHGLVRVGPKRARWTREEWHTKNNEAKATAAAFKAAEAATNDAAARTIAVRALEEKAKAQAAAMLAAAHSDALALRGEAEAKATQAALDRAAAAKDAQRAELARKAADAAKAKARDKLRVAAADREDAGAMWDQADERLKKVRASAVFWRRAGRGAGKVVGGFAGTVSRAFARKIQLRAAEAEKRAAAAIEAAKQADTLKADAERAKQAVERERNALKRDLPGQLDAARAEATKGAQAELTTLRRDNSAMRDAIRRFKEKFGQGPT